MGLHPFHLKDSFCELLGSVKNMRSAEYYTNTKPSDFIGPNSTLTKRKKPKSVQQKCVMSIAKQSPSLQYTTKCLDFS